MIESNIKECLKKGKNLVIYFSRADENYAVGVIEKGNTEVIAEFIRDLIGATLFKVEPVKEYSPNYKICCDEALEEQRKNERPKLKNYLESIDEYDNIFIGSPIYWGTMPQLMFTQLEKLNFSGKNIFVFTTHEGSGLGSVPNDVKKICIGAKYIDSIAIRGSNARTSKNIIENWLK